MSIETSSIHRVGPLSRMFIGFWPTKATCQALQPLSAQALALCGGRALQATQWHITLAFLGAVSAEQKQQLCAQARHWQLPSSPFQIDRYGHFAAQQTLWVGSSDPVSIQGMQQSFAALWAYLQPLGFEPETRPFVPHVSLLRQTTSRAQLPCVSPFQWINQACYIVESRPSVDGSAYYPLVEIPMTAAKNTAKGVR